MKFVVCISLLFRFAYGYPQNEITMRLLEPVQVQFTDGILAEAINKAVTGRINSLPVEQEGFYFKIYSKDSVS